MSFEESYYENADLWRDGSFGDADNERITAVAAKVPADATTLLDAGCGNGLFLKHLRSLGTRSFKRLVGVDRSAAALEHVDTEKVRASLDALPFANREFDAVTCLEVLEHLPQEIYSGTLDEIARVAGRYVLVSVPHDENITMAFTECDNCRFHFNPNYHLRSFDEPALRRLLDSRGFRCLETFFIYPVRLVPVSIESMLRMLGRLKRLVLSQPRAPMVGGTVCPSCGYSDRSSDGTAKGTDTSSAAYERVGFLNMVGNRPEYIKSTVSAVLSGLERHDRFSMVTDARRSASRKYWNSKRVAGCRL